MRASQRGGHAVEGLSRAPAGHAPVDLWSGAYGGVIAGVGFSTGHATLDAFSTGTYQSGINSPVPVYTAYSLAFPGVAKPNTDGFLTGGTIGCNFRSGSFVYGAETDAVINATPSGTSTFLTPALGVAPSVAQIGRAWGRQNDYQIYCLLFS